MGYYFHVKTTIEINDALIRETKMFSAKNQKIIREVMEAALRDFFAKRNAEKTKKKIDFSKYARGHGGLCEGVDLSSRDTYRDLCEREIKL